MEILGIVLYFGLVLVAIVLMVALVGGFIFLLLFSDLGGNEPTVKPDPASTRNETGENDE